MPELREPLIPISHLALELPGRDFVTELRNRGVEITVDDVGRPSISRAVVRQLIQEQRETESRAKEMNEQRFAQLEGERLARLPKGLPWYEVPAGMSAAEAMVAAGGDDRRPRTVPTAGEWMFGDYEVAGSITDAAGE